MTIIPQEVKEYYRKLYLMYGSQFTNEDVDKHYRYFGLSSQFINWSMYEIGKGGYLQWANQTDLFGYVDERPNDIKNNYYIFTQKFIKEFVEA